ncbi:MAG: hypothetical protein CL840_00460 [Crocinitomicaceae bacterium]|nr:hypothetical protein [Crocinitomicaceae bacterium]|tara:strand:+ start:1310 stop:2149 length:840 start_codon:yes stop_codon:yes gene_type:complete
MQGSLRKMTVSLCDQSGVLYSLPLNGNKERAVPINELIGKPITITATGKINCVSCGADTKKSYHQGYCGECAASLPECDSCRVSPEKCHYSQGTCRDPKWGEEECLTPHFVYISFTSGYKVGITRGKNVPSRWLDQGALVATPIFEVRERLLSGVVEDAFREHVSDRTNWRTMLLSDAAPSDEEFKAHVAQLMALMKPAIDKLQLQYGADAIKLTPIDPVRPDYPIGERPMQKLSGTHNFDKQPELSGVLHGVKGQYLYVGQSVVNIRKFAGYEVNLSF